MTVSATARATVRGQDPVVILTPSKGPAVALSEEEGWELVKSLRNALQTIARDKRTHLVESKVRSARKAERELRRPSSVDEELQERDG